MIVAGLLAAALLAPGVGGSVPGDLPGTVRPLAGSAQFAGWTNGQVELTFPTPAPRFLLTSATNSSLSSNETLVGLAEIGARGGMLSFAPFLGNGTRWSFSNTSNATGVRVTLSGAVAPVPTSGEWESGDSAGVADAGLGTAQVTLRFYLNASTRTGAGSVSYDLSVSDWPWIHANDSLGVEVRSTATPATQRWRVSGTNGLDGFAASGPVPTARFSWGAQATATYASGAQEDSSVGAYRNVSNPAGFLVRLEFASITGGYHALSYDPTLSLNLPTLPFAGPAPLPAWVVTTTSLEVIGGATGLCGALALVLRGRRRPPEEDL